MDGDHIHRQDQSATPAAPLTIRALSAADQPKLARLAELEGVGAPSLPALGAELGDRLVAAVSVREPGLEVLADPFLPTAGAVSILRLRAAQLSERRQRSRPRRRLPQLWPAGRRVSALR